jgi:hypothetical protein
MKPLVFILLLAALARTAGDPFDGLAHRADRSWSRNGPEGAVLVKVNSSRIFLPNTAAGLVNGSDAVPVISAAHDDLALAPENAGLADKAARSGVFYPAPVLWYFDREEFIAPPQSTVYRGRKGGGRSKLARPPSTTRQSPRMQRKWLWLGPALVRRA